MSVFYADTSVLLKQHVDEAGSPWFRKLIALPDERIISTELSRVEMYSAFSRLVREGRLTIDVYQEIITELNDLSRGRYHLLAISPRILDIACGVLERQPLRAYDSIHLATAISTEQELITSGKPGLTFLSADHRLLAAAIAEGLPAFNPAAVT